jgi:hypothetical protein
LVRAGHARRTHRATCLPARTEVDTTNGRPTRSCRQTGGRSLFIAETSFLSETYSFLSETYARHAACATSSSAEGCQNYDSRSKAEFPSSSGRRAYGARVNGAGDASPLLPPVDLIRFVRPEFERPSDEHEMRARASRPAELPELARRPCVAADHLVDVVDVGCVGEGNPVASNSLPLGCRSPPYAPYPPSARIHSWAV